MSTTLVVAEPKDRLAQRVCDMIPDVARCTERELLGTCGLELLQDGIAVEGSLTILGRALPLSQLSGVLFRPVRRWRPPSNLGARHRAFVHHETQAAWCAVLNALPCPVLNRVPPTWWYDDILYGAHLTQSFAQQLDLPLSTAGDQWARLNMHAATGPAEKPVSVYALGKHIVAIEPAARPLQSHFAVHQAELEAWQHATGIGFSRIDCTRRNGSAIERVEPLPAMGRTPEAILDELGRRIAEALA